MTTRAERAGAGNRGVFITFEGVEGCGKTTQAELLADWCRAKGYDCVLTREPGGTPLGERVRAVVLDAALAVGSLAELFLYLAARAQHVRTVIRPALDRGQWIVCDRFADSTTAYQGYGRGLGATFVAELNRIATDGLEPDVTFVLETDVRVGLARARTVSRGTDDNGGDRIESDAVEFHETVRRGFRELAANEPGRVRLIEQGSVEDVFAAVVAHVEEFLKERDR